VTNEGFLKAVKVVKLVREASKKLDIAKIREKYGFTGNRIARLHFEDINRYFTFRFDKLGDFQVLEAMSNFIAPPKVNVNIYIASLCVIKHIRNGYIAGYTPGSLAKVQYPYSPLDAWKFGDVQAAGDSSTNDVLAFVNLLREVMQSIDPKELETLIGSCDHD
jgi:hypothetical protein